MILLYTKLLSFLRLIEIALTLRSTVIWRKSPYNLKKSELEPLAIKEEATIACLKLMKNG